MPAPVAVERTEALTIDAVAHCAEFIRSQAQQAGYSFARINEIELVVEEIVSNICRYSYGDRLGNVELCCRRTDGEILAIEFIDRGQPFDILSLPAPDLSVDIEQRDVGGIGVHMMHILVDQLNYRRENARNVLTVVFYPASRWGSASRAP